MGADTQRPTTWQSLKLAFANKRIGAVALQSFASGLPLGLVWIAIPAWLKYLGADLRVIGLFSLAQAPWNFKFLWSPFMDRFAPRVGSLGRKRAWMFVTQGLLVAAIGLLAVQALEPNIARVFVIGVAIAFLSASQDIVIDGYAVEALEKEELGKAVGARVALYRVAMYLSGGFAITAGERFGWPSIYLWLAATFLPLMIVVVWSPEPQSLPPPPTTLRAAVAEPMIEMFKKARAVEILAFIVTFKLGENLATALIRPFLIEKGFTPEDVGVVVTTVSLFANVFGTIAGGVLTDRIGIGRTLWATGIAQAIGCLAYAVVDSAGGPTTTWYVDPARLTMYAAVGGEQFIQGMGAGALGVLMLRLTAKQFSATQFALLSSLVALPRVIVGPFAGVLAYSLGWKLFFIITVPIAIPGLVMLAKFVPFMARDAQIDDAVDEAKRDPITKVALAIRALVAFAMALVVGMSWSALLGGMADSRKQVLAAKSFDDVEPVIVDAIAKHVHALTSPSTPNEWVDLLGPIVFALVVAAGTAALTVARRGISRR